MNDILQVRNIMLSLYGDDTAIISQGETPDKAIVPLQNYLKNLEAWLVRWKIKLNVDKTEAILFNKKNDDWPNGNKNVLCQRTYSVKKGHFHRRNVNQRPQRYLVPGEEYARQEKQLPDIALMAIPDQASRSFS
ncbi:hypothetical protein AVEN_162443-1 [Araneus ventricosus]|uniref:Uncharacterized protein n=1 Tax=Araneus ventricosus TaxID=182803 RepID=A0A4Y2N1W8_ARAVE|nr:hypothetical protein AVEN_162443-1 [Araneus ventricosus]